MRDIIIRPTGAVVLMLLSALAGLAQQAAPTPSSKPNPPGQTQPGAPSTGVTPVPSNAQAVAQPSYLTPIQGLQGVLAETPDGMTVAAQSIDDRFNPASSIKLATALVALKTFGPEHRFPTSVWSNGKIDQTTGVLTGDLIVAGCDPSFHYEQAVMLAQELNALGIRTISGNLLVTSGFTMNFDWSAKRSGEQLRNTMDAARRSAAATKAWSEERTLIGDTASLRTVPTLTVLGNVGTDSAPPGAVPLLTHKSSKLVDILKVLLCYSNNFMAERIGDTIGGPQAVRTMLLEKLKLNPDEVLISSTSGLGVNRVTPRAMMTILRALRDELKQDKLSLSDILPVAGIDPGTLEERYTDTASRGSVIAKTGTLVRTDGGASALVGQMRTRSGRVVLFVIFNQRGNVYRFRQNQDNIVFGIQNSLGGPAPFDYRPVTLAMHLADHSEYETAKARGEYEPRK